MDNEPTPPYHEVLDQIKDTVEDSEFLTAINSPAPLGNDDARAENCTQGFIQFIIILVLKKFFFQWLSRKWRQQWKWFAETNIIETYHYLSDEHDVWHRVFGCFTTVGTACYWNSSGRLREARGCSLRIVSGDRWVSPRSSWYRLD